MAQKILAFVARSFDRADEAKIDPIIKLLDSFKPLGFIPQSADRAEVESVSEKVRSMIDKSDVLVGIFTQRHPVYRFNGRWKDAWGALWGQANSGRVERSTVGSTGIRLRTKREQSLGPVPGDRRRDSRLARRLRIHPI